MVAAVDLKSISVKSISSSLIAGISIKLKESEKKKEKEEKEMLKIKKIERKGEYKIERLVKTDLIKTEIYVGEKSWRWNPLLKGYLRSKTNGIHIFAIGKQLEILRKGLYLIKEIIHQRGKIFLVENNEFNGEAISMLLKKTKQPYLKTKYEAGGITRRKELIRQVKNLSNSRTGVIKKRLFKQLLKMNDIKTKPGLTVIFDSNQGQALINECNRFGIRTIGCGSSALNRPGLTYKWLGNYKGIEKRKILLLLMLQTIFEGIRNEANIFKEFYSKIKRREENIRKKIRKINK